MSTAIKEVLKKNNLPTSTTPPESPEAKLEREKKEKEAGGGGSGNGETPEAKLARELKEKEAAAGGGSGAETPEAKIAREKLEAEQKLQQQQQQQQLPIDDATLLAELQKRGKKISSLEDIKEPAAAEPTPAEKEKLEQDKMDNIRQYGLRNKKATSTDFDNYARETAMDYKDLGFQLFRQERIDALKKANTPADQIPDDKKLREEYDETHFQFAEENDPKRIRSEKLLKKDVDDYINNKYSNILDLEEEYNSDQTTTTQRKVYNETVSNVAKGIGEEMEFNVVIDKAKNETFPFKFKISPEAIKTATQAYVNDVSFNSLGKGEINKDLLQQAIKGSIIQSEIQNILAEGLVAYGSHQLDQIAKGRRGIFPHRKEEGSEGGEKKENKVVKGVLNQAENKKILQTT